MKLILDDSMAKEIFYRCIAIDFPKERNFSFNLLKEKLAKKYPHAHVAPIIMDGNNTYPAPQPITAAAPIPDGSPWIFFQKFPTLFNMNSSVQFGINKILITKNATASIDEEKNNLDKMTEEIRTILDAIEDEGDIKGFSYTSRSGTVDDESFSVAKVFDNLTNVPAIGQAKAKNINLNFAYEMDMSVESGSVPINVNVELVPGMKKTKTGEGSEHDLKCLIMQTVLSINGNINAKGELFAKHVKGLSNTAEQIYNTIVTNS